MKNSKNLSVENHSLLISIDHLLEDKMLVIREHQVLLDEEVASLFQVDLKLLQRKIRENSSGMPEEFLFILNEEEQKRIFPLGTKRKKIFAFTWGGIMTAVAFFHSQRAIEIHLQLIRCYSKGMFEKMF